MTYSEAVAVKLLQDLDNSQAAVEKTSHWFLEFHKLAKDLVKLWFKEFRKAHPKKKIAFLHLANDIIQRGAVIAPEFAKLFEPVLPTAFKETAKVQRHSIRSSVAHLLIVWATRRIYSRNFLRQLRFICQRAVAEADTPDADESTKRNIIAASPFAFSFNAVLTNAITSDNKSSSIIDVNFVDKVQRKRHRPLKSTRVAISFDPDDAKINSNTTYGDLSSSRGSISAFREELARELQTEAIQPPNIEDFIQLLETLQSAASADASTRREIAQFPPEVADTELAMGIIANASEEEKQNFVNRVSGCASRLETYNQLLNEEATKRAQLALQLPAFHSHLKEQINEAENALHNLKTQLDHGRALKEELTKHMLSLPDLNLFPDVTQGLDPLPTVGDLFG